MILFLLFYFAAQAVHAWKAPSWLWLVQSGWLDGHTTAGVPLVADGNIGNAQLGALLAGLAVLIGIYLKVGKAKEQLAEEIMNKIAAKKQTPQLSLQQPLEVVAGVRFASAEEVHILREEFEGFRSAWEDNAERLRDKIEEKFNQAISASNSSASKIHGRIDALAEKQGVMVGELKHMTEAVKSAAESAHAAAIAAATAQAKGGRS